MFAVVIVIFVLTLKGDQNLILANDRHLESGVTTWELG